ncbi:MAG: hypothetical protein ACRDJV_04840 [Actinomycetota bacterium]
MPRRRRRRRNSFGEVETKDGSMTPERFAEKRAQSTDDPLSYVSVPNPNHDPNDPQSPRAILVPTSKYKRDA